MKLRQLFQFRLSTLVLFLLAACGVMGLWQWKMSSHWTQLEALARLEGKAQYVRTQVAEPKWLRYISDPRKYHDVVHISFHGMRKVRDADLIQLSAMPRLERLSFHGTQIGDEGMKHLSNCRVVNTVSVKSTRVTDVGLEYLSGMTQMTKLQLSNSKVTGAGLKALRDMKGLQHLELAGLEIRNSDLDHLMHLKQLTHLDLFHTQITSAGIAKLQQLKSLEQLKLYSRFVNDVKIQKMPRLKTLDCGGGPPWKLELVDLPQLSKLSIFGYRPSETRLTNLPGMTQLPIQRAVVLDRLPLITAATMSGNPDAWTLRDVPKVTNLTLSLTEGSMPLKFATQIGELQRLRTLQIDHSGNGRSRLTGETITPFCDLYRLSQVHLYRMAIDHETTAALSRLPTLNGLVLYDTGLTNAALKQLRELNLHDLQVRSNPIDDRGLIAVRDMNNLVNLDLTGTQVRGSGLRHLQSRSLRSLNLTQCPLDDEQLPRLGEDVISSALQNLVMSNTPIGDRGLERLLADPQKLKLVSLNLASTRVTGASVDTLSQLPLLQTLTMGGNGFDLTDDQIDLCQQFPALRYFHLNVFPKENTRWWPDDRRVPPAVQRLKKALPNVRIYCWVNSGRRRNHYSY